MFETGAGVDRLLFGSLLAIGDSELVVTAAVLAVALLAAAVFRRGWIESGFDDLDPAKPGLRRRAGDLALLTVVAMAAIVAIDAVGALLVGAILVVPAATARLFARASPRLELGAAALA